MRTEAQLKQLAEARTHIVRKPMSEETKKKISIANSQDFFAVCDYCGKEYKTRKSHYARTERHFCCRSCYSKYREEFIPKEEHYAFGTGYSIEEKKKRIKARSIFNHYLRDNHLNRQPCEICGGKAEAHHDNYDEPLKVRWLCFKHHREWHKFHENADLLENKDD
jgi:hypothetical protein